MVVNKESQGLNCGLDERSNLKMPILAQRNCDEHVSKFYRSWIYCISAKRWMKENCSCRQNTKKGIHTHTHTQIIKGEGYKQVQEINIEHVQYAIIIKICSCLYIQYPNLIYQPSPSAGRKKWAAQVFRKNLNRPVKWIKVTRKTLINGKQSSRQKN